MALTKLIIGNRGEELYYHKIDKIIFDNDKKKVSLIMSAYTSPLYREKEKAALMQDQIYSELVEELQRLLADPASNQTDIDIIQNQLNIPYSMERTCIQKDSFEFSIEDFPSDLSLAYEKIKTIEPYIGALDC